MLETNRAWLLISRRLSGEATPQELAELSLYLESDQALQHKFELLYSFWRKEQLAADFIQYSDADKLERIFHLADQVDSPLVQFERYQERKRRRTRWIGAGVSVAAIGVVGFLLINKSQDNNSRPKEQIVAAKYGSRSRTILPDGSTVFLNAGSQIFYDDFSGSTREVRIQGEAFFDVVKMENKPFIVHAEGVDIKVTGTAFNVKSYPEDENVETTLLRGSVEVVKSDGSERLYMKPNQKLTVAKKPEQVKLTTAGSNKRQFNVLEKTLLLTELDSTVKSTELIETAWVYNRLIFRGDKFDELSKKLERWYNVKIFFNDEKTKELRFNGSFEDETIEQALGALKVATNFHFKISNNEIYISSSKK